MGISSELNNIKLGTKFFLNPKNRLKVDSEFELVSCLDAVTDDGYIVLNAPIHNGMPYPFSVGEALAVSFSNEKGRCDLWCVVDELFQEGKRHYIKGELLSDVEYIDCRDAFRVKTSLAGTVSVPARQGDEAQIRKLKCMCTNISEGGATIYFNDKSLEIGDYITVSIPIGPDDKVEDIVSEIRWVAPFDASYRGNYGIHMGIQFHFLESSQQSAVMKYVLLCQQKMMRIRRLRRQ